MSVEHDQELAMAYLLNELSEEQRIECEARLARDEDFAQIVDDLERSMGVALMADSKLAEPDPGLRDRILDSIPDAEVSSEGVSKEQREEKVKSFPVLMALGWAAAACFAVVFFNARYSIQTLQVDKQETELKNDMLQSRVEELSESVESALVSNSELQTEIENLSESVLSALARNEEIQITLNSAQSSNKDLETSLEATQTANEALRTELEQLSVQLAQAENEREQLQSVVTNLRRQSVLDKIQIAALSSEVDELRYGFAVWDGDSDQGIVKVFNMAALDLPNQDYQFWVISPEQESPIPAGVFQVDALGQAEYGFAPNKAVMEVGAFAISLEPKGGSLTPTGPIVLSGAL